MLYVLADFKYDPPEEVGKAFGRRSLTFTLIMHEHTGTVGHHKSHFVVVMTACGMKNPGNSALVLIMDALTPILVLGIGPIPCSFTHTHKNCSHSNI